MFIEINTEKIIKLAIVTFLIIFGVYSSLLLNSSYSVGSRAKIALEKIRATLVYSRFKVMNNDESAPPRSFFNIASAFTGFGEQSGVNLLQGGIWGPLSIPPNAVSVPVLVYHGVPDEGAGNVDKKEFDKQLKTLKAAGWQSVSLSDFYMFIRGEKDLPDRSFLLTFDDGRKDSFYPVDPILKDLGFNAVMFAISGDSVDKNRDFPSVYYLSETELRDMEKNGRWEVESHGRFAHRLYSISKDGDEGYFLVNKLWLGLLGRQETTEEFERRVKSDLQGAKDDLEIALDKKITAFAYPFSEFGMHSANYPESKAILKKIIPSIYEMAFYQVNLDSNETFNYKGGYSEKNGWMLKRIEPSKDWTSDRLLEELETGRAKVLPYNSNSFSREWHSSWGMMQGTSTLVLKADANGSGASTYLGGTLHWKNYLYSAHAKWRDGTHFMLTARHKNDNSYAICDFYQDRVSVRSKIDGVGEGISSEKIMDLDTSQGVEVRMKVEDNVVSCWIGDRRIVIAPIPASLTNGGVGLEVWNHDLGKAEAEVSVVTAKAI
jgi:peptidoglycan/xylan/chitin deacetylase (PgdA/CDA1 family)